MTEHDRRALAPKIKSVHSPDVLAEFARSHWFCQVCGRAGDLTQHHIIGGRGGRSDEPCNLLSCCWIPCHSAFADMSINLPVVLTMKWRAGELTAADLERLAILHGRTLPDFAPIPERDMQVFERARGFQLSAQAAAVHAWSRGAQSLRSALDAIVPPG